uniref:Mobile element protein n=1 Tax=Vibrio tasmaniensis TaxID=212663 RepID=A0A0H3ZUI2_9VIBR|nr:hypothetical protein [Vibrio tasmaniensis]
MWAYRYARPTPSEKRNSRLRCILLFYYSKEVGLALLNAHKSKSIS